MEERNMTPELPEGLSERLLREILRTPPLKEVLLLRMKDIDPDTAPGLIRTLFWEDPGVFLSIFGALPDTINWVLELLLEMGRQFNDLPGPLLNDFLGRIGSGIDQERLRQIPDVYGQLAQRLLLGEGQTAEQVQALISQAVNAALAGADRLTSQMDENREEIARALARGLDEMDVEPLGRVFNRLLGLSNAVRRSRRVAVKDQLKALLSQVDSKEVFAAVGGFMKDSMAMGWAFITWSIRSLKGK